MSGEEKVKYKFNLSRALLKNPSDYSINGQDRQSLTFIRAPSGAGTPKEKYLDMSLSRNKSKEDS